MKKNVLISLNQKKTNVAEHSLSTTGRMLIFIFMFIPFSILVLTCTKDEPEPKPEIEYVKYNGYNYKTMQIGSQWWFAENLQTTKYNDGTDIPNVTSDTSWAYLTSEAYCWYNNDEVTNKNLYGALYKWYAVKTGKLCPAGWHVPTDTEWTTLENYLIANGYNYDGTTSINKIAKSMAATTNWQSSTNVGAIGNNLAKNNKSGFSGLPGGHRLGSGPFLSIGSYGHWWSSTEYSATFAWYRDLDCNFAFLTRTFGHKDNGYSVRCLRD